MSYHKNGRNGHAVGLDGVVSEGLAWLTQHLSAPTKLVQARASAMVKPSVMTAPAPTPYSEPYPVTTPPPEAYRAPAMRQMSLVPGGRGAAMKSLGFFGGGIVGAKKWKKHPVLGFLVGSTIGWAAVGVITG